MLTTKIYADVRSRNTVIKIRLGKDRKAAFITIPSITIEPHQWDGKSVVSHPSAKLFNAIITEEKAKIDKAIFLLGDTLEFRDVFEIKEILLEYLKPEEQARAKRLLLPAIREKAERCKKANTRGVYNSMANRIEDYESRASSITFDMINTRWLKEFSRYMLNNGNKQNTVAAYMRHLRAVFNDAISDGITTNYPFRSYSIQQEETSKRSLTVKELREVFNFSCPVFFQASVDYFKLIFLLAGINVADLYNLKDSDYYQGYIHYRRAKTGRLYNIPVYPEAAKLIEKLKGKDGYLVDLANKGKIASMTRTINFGLQHLGYDYNYKTIPGMLREGEARFPELTTYWARHSFATIAYELDIPIETIAAVLGHKYGSKVTSVYIKPNQSKADKAIRKVIDYVLYDIK